MLASVARPVITELLEVAVALREEAELQRGVVTVVAMPTFAYMLLTRLMCRYAELHPNVEIQLLDFDSSVGLQMLQTGAADLAVLARTEDMGDLEFVPMFQDEFVVLIPLGSAMFNGRTVVPVEEVAVERLVLSPKGHRRAHESLAGKQHFVIAVVVGRAFVERRLPLSWQTASNFWTSLRLAHGRRLYTGSATSSCVSKLISGTVSMSCNRSNNAGRRWRAIARWAQSSNLSHISSRVMAESPPRPTS